MCVIQYLASVMLTRPQVTRPRPEHVRPRQGQGLSVVFKARPRPRPDRYKVEAEPIHCT